MSRQRPRLATEHGERIAILEERSETTDEKLVAINARLGAIETRLDELMNVLTQAKGIRWLVVLLAGVAGVTAASVSATVGLLKYLGG